MLQLFNELEIQLLVLLSFMLQMFLFFTGNIRRHITNKLLRGIIWMAYLGADFVAVYVLGLLSRHKGVTTNDGKPMETNTLAFFWAPFLLIHLGGQDTITAFAMEDNSLWLRHLLNLVIQVFLASYVFWKSCGNDNEQLLFPAIFVFVAGIIKYGERTMALMYGNPQTIMETSIKEKNGTETSSEEQNGTTTLDPSIVAGYEKTICLALDSVPTIRGLFAGCMYLQGQQFHKEIIPELLRVMDDNPFSFPKFLDVELRVMYDDLYTKAAVLRTRNGVILRCISQVSAMVALMLFTVTPKQRYSRADIAITYTLFVGGLFLEFNAMFTTFMVSPWVWQWLKARGHRLLTDVAWFLLSSNISGWPEKRTFWSRSMGQYGFLSYMGCEKPATPSARAMSMIRKMAKAAGIGGEKLFRLSKLLDTKQEEVSDHTTQCVMNAILDILSARDHGEWNQVGPLLKHTISKNSPDFVYFILVLHILTEIKLGEIRLEDAHEENTVALDANVCRMLSNYMFYIVVAHPASMLQVVAGSPEAALQGMRGRIMRKLHGREGDVDGKDAVLSCARELIKEELVDAVQKELHQEIQGEMRMRLDDLLRPPHRQTLEERRTVEELRDMWVRLLVYAAGKSRPEAHAAQLARGGELLTFVWLLLAHFTAGDWGVRIELCDCTAGLLDPVSTFLSRTLAPDWRNLLGMV